MINGLKFLLMPSGEKAAEKPNDVLDRILERHDKKIFQLNNLIHPSPQAEPRHTFTPKIPASEMAMATLSGRQRLKILPIMPRLLFEMEKSAGFYKQRFQPKSSQISAEALKEIEDLALARGATAVKYVKVAGDAIFEGKAAPEPYALVFTVKMDKDKMDTAPSFEAFREVARGYMRMAIIANIVTARLRKLGYAAYPGTALGGLTDYCRLAELAGIGAIGYHGLLISPEDGALLRINTIYTNIENLPIPEENPHAWVRDFCARCRKCVRSCPVDAIYEQPQPQPNGRVKCIDAKSCLDYFAANFGCGVCIDVCPFSQMGYDVIQERFKGNPNAPHFSIPMKIALEERGRLHLPQA
jgi:epoxyqueuosine reductase